jgi:hypothetical protein
MSTAELQERVARAAENALADNGYVSPLDVLVGMRWLEPVGRPGAPYAPGHRTSKRGPGTKIACRP